MSGRYCVISTMKNEGPFVLEWLAHYKALGFDDFVVCTNDCEDSTTDLLLALQDRGLVRHHATRKWETTSIHRAALKQASRADQVKKAEWVFVCDADEFLNIKVGDGSVRDLVALSGTEKDVISVPWRIFGPNGVERFADEPVTRQFTMAEPPPAIRLEAGKFVKSLFTNAVRDKIRRIGLHAPVPQPEHAASLYTVLPGGVPYIRDGKRTVNQPSFDVAQVNHYALRSVDSYLVKRARGRANHMTHVLGLDYWHKFNHNDMEDTSIRRYDDKVAEWHDRLMSDAQLKALHQVSVDWYARKADELRADPELAELIAGINATLPRPSSASAA
jgi:hypothetical protein